jgi:hypothetical protein
MIIQIESNIVTRPQYQMEYDLSQLEFCSDLSLMCLNILLFVQACFQLILLLQSLLGSVKS